MATQIKPIDVLGSSMFEPPDLTSHAFPEHHEGPQFPLLQVPVQVLAASALQALVGTRPLR